MGKYYINHCWKCGQIVSSKNAKRCRICGWYICPSCESCDPECEIFDAEGYNNDGYDILGYDRDGYNILGFNNKNMHRNGSKYAPNGYDFFGYDKDGYDKKGYNAEGYDRGGYDIRGYNKNGFDINGFNKNGFNILGKHKNGTYFDDEGNNVKGETRYSLKNHMFPVGKWVYYKRKDICKKGKIVKRENNEVLIAFCDGSCARYNLEILINKDIIKPI